MDLHTAAYFPLGAWPHLPALYIPTNFAPCPLTTSELLLVLFVPLRWPNSLYLWNYSSFILLISVSPSYAPVLMFLQHFACSTLNYLNLIPTFCSYLYAVHSPTATGLWGPWTQAHILISLCIFRAWAYLANRRSSKYLLNNAWINKWMNECRHACYGSYPSSHMEEELN